MGQHDEGRWGLSLRLSEPAMKPGTTNATAVKSGSCSFIHFSELPLSSLIIFCASLCQLVRLVERRAVFTENQNNARRWAREEECAHVCVVGGWGLGELLLMIHCHHQNDSAFR